MSNLSGDRRTKIHLFPTTLASFECSSINSESQSRPLAVKPSPKQRVSTHSREENADAPRESVTNRKAATAAAKLMNRVSVFGMGDTRKTLYGP